MLSFDGGANDGDEECPETPEDRLCGVFWCDECDELLERDETILRHVAPLEAELGETVARFLAHAADRMHRRIRALPRARSPLATAKALAHPGHKAAKERLRRSGPSEPRAHGEKLSRELAERERRAKAAKEATPPKMARVNIQELVFQIVKEFPGKTPRELGAVLRRRGADFSHVTISSRLSYLKSLKRVRRESIRTNGARTFRYWEAGA